MIRNPRSIGAGFALLALLALHTPADAAQVNIPASIFHKQISAPDVIWYSGVSSSNFSGSTLSMIAPLPRVPGAGGVTVFVDGYGVSGGPYNCTVYSSSGASKSFSRNTALSWTASVNFTSVEISSSSYLSLTCSVPPDGAFKGITVVG